MIFLSECTVAEQPESTTVEVPPAKTPEEMQQEAEQKGWLKVWHEFTWWYPWYRLRIKININPTIHVAFNPIFPGGESYNWEGLEIFTAIAEEVIQEFIIDVIGIFTGYLAAKALSIWNPAVGIFAELAKGVLQFGLLVASNWDNKMRLLVSAVVNVIMGFIALKSSIGKAFIEALCRLTAAPASSALLNLHFKLLHVLFVAEFIGRWWLDILEVAIDWVIGGIALGRFLTMS
jgi:hypothetical protein